MDLEHSPIQFFFIISFLFSYGVKWISAQRLALCPCGVLVGGTRERHYDGTSPKPRKLPENAHAAKQQSHHYSPGVLYRGSGAKCRVIFPGARFVSLLFIQAIFTFI